MAKKEDTRTRVQLILSVALVIFGCGLILAGLIIDPKGEIHPSVLTAFGEILTFAGAIIGVDYRYKIKTLIHLHGKDNGTDDEETVQKD